jgi:hypothetical protein
MFEFEWRLMCDCHVDIVLVDYSDPHLHGFDLITAVLLRGLDVLSTEDSVLQAIKSISSVPIRSIRIGQDPLTNTSRGVCYLEMNHVMDAVYMHNALVASSPIVDGRKGRRLYMQ